MSNELDQADIAILKLLQTDASLTNKEISYKLSKSVATVHERIRKLKEKGYTLAPLRIFLNEKNLVKVEFGLAKGKKLHDKRQSIRQKDVEREMKRHLK